MINPENRNRVLIRFMDERYVDSFVNEGLLYMNNIRFFREYEGADLALRGDSNEGLIASYLPQSTTLELNGHILEDLVGKVDFRAVHHDDTNIYCMTILSDKDILDAGQTGLYLSNEFSKFGNKAVFIGGNNITTFFNRVKKSIESNSSLYSAEDEFIVGKKITYVERMEHHSRLSIFNKFSEYSWQFEWRLALKQKNATGPLELRIGSLSDIVHISDTKSLIETPFKLQVGNP